MNSVINPWKVAFIAIFFSNIIFHASPAFLLLLILLVIFGYVYYFISYLFNNFADAYVQDVVSRIDSEYFGLKSSLKQIKVSFLSFCNLPHFFLQFTGVWSINILSYECDSLTNNKNYLLSILFDAYQNQKVFLIQDFFFLDTLNEQQTTHFLESGLFKY